MVKPVLSLSKGAPEGSRQALRRQPEACPERSRRGTEAQVQGLSSALGQDVKRMARPVCEQVVKAAADRVCVNVSGLTGMALGAQDGDPRDRGLIKDAASRCRFFEPCLPNAGRPSGHLPFPSCKHREPRDSAAQLVRSAGHGEVAKLEALLPPQGRPCDARQLAGERSQDGVAMGSREHAPEPRPERRSAPGERRHRRSRAVDEQCAGKCRRASRCRAASAGRRWCAAWARARASAQVPPSPGTTVAAPHEAETQIVHALLARRGGR